MSFTVSARVRNNRIFLLLSTLAFLLPVYSYSAYSQTLQWDPDLTALGVTHQPATPTPGTWYWRLVEAVLDDTSGRVVIEMRCRNENDVYIENQMIWMSWNGGSTSALTKGPIDNYWGNIPMSGNNWCPATPPGPYTGYVDGVSDRVVGMGLPCNLHYSYSLTYKWTLASGTAATNTPVGPTPTPTPTSPAPSSTPVVNNPSFEFALTGNWTIWYGTGGNTDPLERDYFASGLPDGVWALAVKGIGSGGKGAYQYIPSGWVFGQIYRLSVYVKNLSNTNMNYSIGYALGDTGSAGGSSATYGTAIVHPSAWTQATVQFTYTGATGVTIYLRAVNDGSAERAGFDHVQITDLGPSSPTATPTNTVPAGPTFTPTRTPTGGPPSTATPTGQPRWLLTYGREYGEFMTGGVGGQVDIFATTENGAFTVAGFTNDSNPTTAIFGYTQPASNPFTPGNLRVTFSPTNSTYDFHVYDPSVASDRSVDCWWVSGLPHHGHYRFEFHWRLVSNNNAVTVFPYAPVYHYDLVNTFNTQTTEAANWSSDGYALTSWESYHAQTFVVPAGVNRIIECKAFAARQQGVKFRMVASIRQGGPTGTQIGPSVTSRELDNTEFPNVLMCWDINDVPVTPGGTYALRIESADGQGFNMFATNNNNYPSGNLYNGTTSVSGKDMIGVVVGAFTGGGGTPGPTATPTRTPTPTPTTVSSNLLGNWSFELSSGTSHPSWTNPGNAYGTNGMFPNPGGAFDQSQWASYSYGDGSAVTQDLYQTVTVTPGHTYRLSTRAYLHGTNGSATARLVWVNGAYPGTGGGTPLASQTWTYPASQIVWTELTGLATPTGSSLTFIIRTEISGYGGGINWDACSLVDQTVASTATPAPTATRTPTPTGVASTPTPSPFPTQSRVDIKLWENYE